MKRGITISVALMIAAMGVAASGEQAPADKPQREFRGTPVTMGKLGYPIGGNTFPEEAAWPPRNVLKLEPFLVNEEALTPEVTIEWQGQEDWLLAICRLTFQWNGEEDLKTFRLQNWRTGKESKEAEEDKRGVYVEWEHDGLSFFGRRDFRKGKCLFLVLPRPGEQFDFAGTLPSARNLLDSLVSERVKLSLTPLKQPRTIPVNEGDGRTVRKVFKTPVMVNEEHGDVLHVNYWPETDDASGLRPSVWVSRDRLLIVIPDPVMTAWSGEGLVPLSPPPDSLTNPKNATLDDAVHAVDSLHVGMSHDDALEVIGKHGIHPSGVTGGSMAWGAGAILSDKSQLLLDFRHQSQELRDKGPSKLTGWKVLDPSGELLSKYSLSEPPDSPKTFIKKYSKFLEIDARPEMTWEFLSNGTFKAYSMTSSYGFSIEGTWKVLKNDQIALSGTTYNTRTKQKKQLSDIFKRMIILKHRPNFESSVKIEHETEISAF
ncbi:MAG: hypothetical protein RRC34_02730 [Lentisphaeria bacterium]|nr:hypothetical protein [Lentisphaeria bacterium]